MQAVLERLEKLERQNRRLRGVGVLAIGAVGVLVLMGQAGPRSNIVEAQQFIVKDSQGKLRVWLGVGQPRVSDATRTLPMGVIASGEATGLFLYDDRGREQTQLFATPGGGVVYINTPSGPTAQVSGEGVTLFGPDGKLAADFKNGPSGAGYLDLHGENGRERIVLDGTQKTPPGEPIIYVMGKDGKVIWRAP
jgi:hypothetical protein